MGIDLADVDEDGWTDVIMGNYSMETDTLFRNLGGLVFEDMTDRSGISTAFPPDHDLGPALLRCRQ